MSVCPRCVFSRWVLTCLFLTCPFLDGYQENTHFYVSTSLYKRVCVQDASSLGGNCSTVQGLLDWFEVDLGLTKLLFIQIDLCGLCMYVFMDSLFVRIRIRAHVHTYTYKHDKNIHTRLVHMYVHTKIHI